MIKKLERVIDIELIIPHNKTFSTVKVEDCERVEISRMPNDKEIFDKINEIIDVLNNAVEVEE